MVLVFAYTPPSYGDFLAFGEKVNIEIFHAFDEQGMGLPISPGALCGA